MSQSTTLSATDSAEASQPGLEASGGQDISLSDLSPHPPATDEALSAPAMKPTEEGSLVRFRIWISENKMAVSGWVVALLSLVVTVIAMVPGFRSESMSQRALELAEWTALKDFIENCKRDHQAGLASIACQEAITQPLPPPPHVQITSSIIKRWTDNGCNCQQRDETIYLKKAVAIIIPMAICIMLDALYDAIHKTWYTEVPKCHYIRNTRSSRVKSFAKQISKILCYEMINHDAQVAEARSKNRFECVSGADLALSDRKKTVERVQYNMERWAEEITSLGTSALIAMDKARINGLIGLVTGILALALSIYESQALRD